MRRRSYSRAEAIRLKCKDCTCNQLAEISKCTIVNCALWPFRMGTSSPSDVQKWVETTPPMYMKGDTDEDIDESDTNEDSDNETW